MKKNLANLISVLMMIVMFSVVAFSQTTEFTYQGSLKDGAVAANANYDFEFLLYDALSGGTQVGSTLTRSGVGVANGIFSVNLDFGSNYPGADRFLEIHVRLTGSGGFTQLLPRQPVSSAPYSVRSLNAAAADTATNATQLGGVAASQYVVTGDPRMTDARDPLPNSPNYVENTAVQQSASNFNVSGNGTVGGTFTANTVRATAQYNIGSSRVLTAGTTNVFVGISAGAANPTGTNNSFFGNSAGSANTTGDSNAFFGYTAGQFNTTTRANSFFGANAGRNNTANDNAFFGTSAGLNNTTGAGNTFLGRSSGLSNTTESNNTFIGSNSNGAAGITHSTAIGAGAVVISSNFIVLGTSADHVGVPGFLQVTGSLTTQGTLFVDSALTVFNLSSAGSEPVCRNASLQISFCSSSLRYKTAVQPFSGGLDIVRRLRPITFDWRQGGMHDVGFAAEEVNEIEPLLTTRNDKGEIEGVKYGQITTVLVNAVKEQQVQIEAQQKQIEEQRKQIESLTKIVCAINPKADTCQQ